MWQETPYTIPLVATAMVTVLSALYVRERVQASGAGIAALLLMISAFWTMTYALEIASADLAAKLLWAKIEYLGIVVVPVTWLCFALRYTGNEERLTPRVLALLGVAPALTVLLVFTNESHGLVWSRTSLDAAVGFSMLQVGHGAWFYVHTLYSYSLVFAATLLLVQMLRRSRDLYGWQIGTLLLVTLMPWLGNFMYVSGLNPFPEIDPTPLTFTAAGLLLAGSLSFLRLGDIVTVSRQAIIDSMSDGVLVLDSRNRIVFVNPAARALIGGTDQELIGRPVGRVWGEWIDPLGFPEGRAEAPRELVLDREGSKLTYDVRTSCQRDWRGRLLSQVVVLRDITERKRVEDELRSTEERLRNVVEHAPVVLYTLDRNGVFTLSEGKALEVLGLKPGQVVGQSVFDLYREEPTILEHNRRALAGEALGGVVEMSAIGVAWESRYFPLRDRNGEVTGVIGVATDITERRRAENALLWFKLGIGRSSDAVFITEADGTIVYVNPAFEKTYGYSREEALGKTPRILRSGVMPPESYQQLWATLLSKRSVAGDLINRTRDGRLINVEGSANPILDEAGEILGFLAIQRDITQRKQLEEQLRRAQRLETAGRIAAQVAHDFNNLLTPLAAYPELIKMLLPEQHAAARYCDPMMEAVSQMAEINADMLALARRGHLDPRPTDLNRLAREAVEQMMGLPSHLRVQMELAPDLPPAAGSAAQLMRVLANLVSNAREAMQDLGTLTVRTENVYVDLPFGRYNRVEVGEYVRLSVSDTGCGIPTENRDKIFDTFFTTKRADKKPGSGLGLSIVQAIVDDHKGYLDLETEMGKGTTFSIYLPVSQEALGEAPRDGLPEGTESVLVVDDDRFQRDAATEMLTRLGYQVETASSGEEAIERLKKHPVDLLILDMVMPGGIDGTDTYRRVLEVRPEQRAIIASGFAESERVREAQALGAGDYVRKPMTVGKLARAVRAELDRQ